MQNSEVGTMPALSDRWQLKKLSTLCLTPFPLNPPFPGARARGTFLCIREKLRQNSNLRVSYVFTLPVYGEGGTLLADRVGSKMLNSTYIKQGLSHPQCNATISPTLCP